MADRPQPSSINCCTARSSHSRPKRIRLQERSTSKQLDDSLILSMMVQVIPLQWNRNRQLTSRLPPYLFATRLRPRNRQRPSCTPFSALRKLDVPA